MKTRSKKNKSATKDYLEKAKTLSKKDAERLMARMRGRFLRRYEDNKFTAVEVVALQLEFEDEQLAEWRQKIVEIRKNRED